MEAILGVLLPYLLPTIGTALAGLLVKGVMALLAKLAAKTTDTHKLELLSFVADAAEKAILTIEQTVVDKLKKEGKWGPDSYKTAAEAGLVVLKGLVKDVLPQLTKLGFEVGDEYLKALLESALKKLTP